MLRTQGRCQTVDLRGRQQRASCSSAEVKISHFCTSPVTHTSSRQNCTSIQGCRKGDAVAPEPAARCQARTCQTLLAASDTCGLLPGPDTGAAPVHAQAGGPAQILHLARQVYMRSTLCVSLVTPKPRGILVPEPGDGILMPKRPVTTLEWLFRSSGTVGETRPGLIRPGRRSFNTALNSPLALNY